MSSIHKSLGCHQGLIFALSHALILIQTINFEEVNEYEDLRRNGFVGFAQEYLGRCEMKSNSEDEIDVKVYDKLVALDTKLGTTVAEQLFDCLVYTLRLDVIKV